MASEGLSTAWNHLEKDLKIIVLKTDNGRNDKWGMHPLSLTHIAPSWQAHSCPHLLIYIWYLIRSVLVPAPGKAQICKEQPRACHQLEIHREHDLHGLPTYSRYWSDTEHSPCSTCNWKDIPAALAVIVAILRLLPLWVKWPISCHLVSQSTEWAGGILIIIDLQERTKSKEGVHRSE